MSDKGKSKQKKTSQAIPRLGPATIELPALFTMQQVADYFGVSIRTVQYWNVIRTGPTPIIVGKHVSYTGASILAYMEKQTRGSTAKATRRARQGPHPRSRRRMAHPDDGS